jgi:hypothetical protein
MLISFVAIYLLPTYDNYDVSNLTFPNERLPLLRGHPSPDTVTDSKHVI